MNILRAVDTPLSTPEVAWAMLQARGLDYRGPGVHRRRQPGVRNPRRTGEESADPAHSRIRTNAVVR
jgi:hypothetical protein